MIPASGSWLRSRAQRTTHRLRRATRRKTDKKLGECEPTRRCIADCNERVDGTGDDESGDSAARHTILRTSSIAPFSFSKADRQRTKILAIRAGHATRPRNLGNAGAVRSMQVHRVLVLAGRCKRSKAQMPATPAIRRQHVPGALDPPWPRLRQPGLSRSRLESGLSVAMTWAVQSSKVGQRAGRLWFHASLVRSRGSRSFQFGGPCTRNTSRHRTIPPPLPP